MLPAQASDRDAAPVGRMTVEGSDIICRGVVVARGPNLIVVLDTGETRIIIIISATTRFHGFRASWAALQANDRVVIVGQANGDGTVAAREVQVIGVSR
ncbi:MAG: hypothetical protein AUI83_15225 [Armatimonadetes bacterium 13_1_40CM_3_65_7]|nr:MAG: hypothetical protein AUI83_15225 [Armatimonadetes bacterium 13_1_40CM_3_65_7]